MKKFLGLSILLMFFVFVSKFDVYAAEIKNSILQLNEENETDITRELNEALLIATQNASSSKPVTVKIPAGEYMISGCIHIFSNTTLDLTAGVTIKYADDSTNFQNMLLFGTNSSYNGYRDYNNSEACKGYNGFENISVRGGTWVGSDNNESVLFRIAHARNVVFDGVEFVGGGGLHQIELAAVDGLVVKNCTFRNFVGKYEDGKKMEALQLDIPCSTNTFKDYYLDGTVLKNVLITGCEFENVPRGIGTHSMLIGAYHDGIKIENNTFNNIQEEAIVCLAYKNCQITNNFITNCGAGILYQFFKYNGNGVYSTIFDGVAYAGQAEHDANAVISGNSISTVFSSTCSENAGIKIYGLNISSNIPGKDNVPIPAGDYYISGVSVTNNSIDSSGYGIRLLDAKSCTISNNKVYARKTSPDDISADEYDGIQLSNASTDVHVSSNIVSGFARNGVYLRAGSAAADITSNQISQCSANGISMYMDCSSGSMSNNTMSNCTNSGIKASTGCSTGKIFRNIINGVSDEAGIVLYNSSSAAEISENKITAEHGYGIKISKNSLSGDINKNEIPKSKKNAIYVLTSSSISSTISGIKINNVRAPFNILSTKNDVNILNNVIKGAYSNIFVVDVKTKKYTFNISGNSLSGNTTSTGIWLKSGKFCVKDNTIQKVGKGITTQAQSAGNIYYNKYKSTVKTQMDLNAKKSYKLSNQKINIKEIDCSKKRKCVLDWNKYKYANQYEIQYSTKNDFSKNVKTIKVSNKRKNITLTKLKSKKTYYVRIRAISKVKNIKVYNSYGSIKKIKMK